MRALDKLVNCVHFQEIFDFGLDARMDLCTPFHFQSFEFGDNMKISASLLIFNTFFNPALAASEAGEGLAYIRIVQTKEGSRATPFSDLPEIQFKPNKGIDDATALTINPNVQFQTIEGFGGAMTESSAAILDKLPKDLYDEVMDSYFSKNGLG